MTEWVSHETDRMVAPWNRKYHEFSAAKCTDGLAAPEKAMAAFAKWREKREPNSAGLWHLLTSCGFRGGTVGGIAYVATLCSKYHSVGITSSARGISKAWITLAHEIGHNFGVSAALLA
jgi:hypothetical protein